MQGYFQTIFINLIIEGVKEVEKADFK